MLTETDLLSEIIQNANEGSIWRISSDSWEGLINFFSQFRLTKVDIGYELEIRNEHKENIINSIKKYDIGEKIIHQSILFGNEIVFQSYDHMAISFLKSDFTNYLEIRKKFKDIDLQELIV